MSTATIIMVVLICVGCALGIAGLAVLGYQAWQPASRPPARPGISSRAQLQEVMGRAQRLAPALRELEAKQRVVAEKLSTPFGHDPQVPLVRVGDRRAAKSLRRPRRCRPPAARPTAPR